MRRARFWIMMAAVTLAGACATGGGMVGAVSLASPQEVSGDETAIAWPFTVTHASGEEPFADFHLRIEDGATLLAVRPDADNPDPEATYRWSGEVRAGNAAYWIGDVLPPGGQVRLVVMVRPTGTGDPTMRVVHWPTNGRDDPIGPETCETWRYDTRSGKTSRTGC